MRFADKRYYIERYVKCDNCGVLVYDDGVPGRTEGQIYCGDWCREWSARRAAGVDEPRLPLPREAVGSER